MLAALMMISTIIFAQKKSQHGHKNGYENREGHLKKSLLLTDDQFTKVKSINESFMKQFATIRQDTAMSQGTARAKTRKLHEEHQTQMRTVLNDPQWAKWTEMHKRGKDGKRPSHNRRPGSGHPKPRHEDRG